MSHVHDAYYKLLFTLFEHWANTFSWNKPSNAILMSLEASRDRNIQYWSHSEPFNMSHNN